MSPTLDRAQIQELVHQAADRLEGEWVLLGGSLACLWLSSPRSTRDIDLVSIRGSNQDRLSLMELAEELGLPIEAVNPAADFFLKRISDWRQQLELLLQGRRATIYRPNATLFLLLKLERLSESDLHDCLFLLDHVRSHNVSLDRDRVRRKLTELPAATSTDLQERRQRLEERLTL